MIFYMDSGSLGSKMMLTFIPQEFTVSMDKQTRAVFVKHFFLVSKSS